MATKSRRAACASSLDQFESFAHAGPSAGEGERAALDSLIANAAREDIPSAVVQQLRDEFNRYCARTDAALAELLASVIEIRGDLAEIRRRASRAAGSSVTKLPAGWVTLKQAAFETGYHRERIRQWAIEKSIKGKRDGGCWRVNLESVIAQARKVPSAP
jgi:hypothetical protein